MPGNTDTCMTADMTVVGLDSSLQQATLQTTLSQLLKKALAPYHVSYPPMTTVFSACLQSESTLQLKPQFCTCGDVGMYNREMNNILTCCLGNGHSWNVELHHHKQ